METKPRLMHVEGHTLKDIPIHTERPIGLLDGDVYILDLGSRIYIWIGKDSSVDEKTVAAWLTNKLDQERGGTPDVQTILQGEEPDLFKQNLNFTVIDGDTPGFLKAAELDMVEYKLYRIFTKKETDTFDEVFVEQVPLDRSSLNSGDVYVLDGNESIFCWIGKGANLEERIRGQRLMQKIDADRHYLPLQYSVTEGEGDKAELAFYTLLDKVKAMGKVVSVEDQRELQYRPETALTADEAKMQADKLYTTADPNSAPIKFEPAMGSDAARMGSVMSKKEKS